MTTSNDSPAFPRLAYDDLRGFLRVLDERGLLRHVTRAVDRRYEVAAGIRRVSDEDGPALVFDEISGFELPIVGGVFATRRLALAALGVDDYADAVQRFGQGVESPIEPRVVDDAPCQEVVVTGDDIDVQRLPHPIYSAGDSGPFIASGVIITRDPDTGIQNAGIYRMEVKGPRKLCLEAPKYQHVHVARAKAEGGAGLDLAVVIGADPTVYYASQAKVGYGVDELGIAGGIRGEPLAVTRGKTADVLVPATAEIVIEGRFVPGETMQEGPFGEFTGYQTPSAQQPVVDVTAVTHRRNPLYQAVLTGPPTTENHILKTFGHDWGLRRYLMQQFPEVTGATVPTAGGVQYLAVVALKQTHPGQGRKVLLAALGGPNRAKVVIVVDSDVDIYDLEQVMWAVATHVQADEDLIIVPGVAGSIIDPSARTPGVIGLLGIDATRALDRDFPPAVTIPGVAEFTF